MIKIIKDPGDRMFKILCIDHVVLRTMNVEEMTSFYCDTLGCSIEKVQEKIGLTQLRAGDSIIDLLQAKTAISEVGYNLDHFCLRIWPFDFNYLTDYFKSKKVHVYNHGERYGAQGYGESLYLRDPDGNEIELKSAKI